MNRACGSPLTFRGPDGAFGVYAREGYHLPLVSNTFVRLLKEGLAHTLLSNSFPATTLDVASPSVAPDDAAYRMVALRNVHLACLLLAMMALPEPAGDPDLVYTSF